MKKLIQWVSHMSLLMWVMVMSTLSASAYQSVDISRAGKAHDAFAAFFDEYRIVIGYVTAFGTLTSLLIFIFHMINLANLSSHPIKRRQAMMNIVISLICTALLGGLTTISFLFYSIIFK